MLRPMHLILLTLAIAGLLTGCKEDPKPDPARKPDAPVGDTQLRDTIQRPIDRANGVEKTIQDAKDKEDQQLQNEEGGSASPASQ